jgi:hypothetical protein
MPAHPAYQPIVAIVVFASLVPSFVVACTRVQFAYVAGLACGIVVLVAELYLTDRIRWDELFYVLVLVLVLLLPLVGMAAGAAWQSRKRSRVIASLFLLAGALCVVATNARSVSASVDVPFTADIRVPS